MGLPLISRSVIVRTLIATTVPTIRFYFALSNSLRGVSLALFRRCLQFNNIDNGRENSQAMGVTNDKREAPLISPIEAQAFNSPLFLVN